MNYQPTPEPMPGKRWEPSNRDECDLFMGVNCAYCERDKDMREGDDYDECDDNECCEIIAAAFLGKAVEWREMPDGTAKCVKFIEAGTSTPPERDTQTVDMWTGP